MKFAKMVRGAAAVALSGLLACFAVAPAVARAEEPAGHVAGEQAGLLDGPLFPDFNIGPVSVFGTFSTRCRRRSMPSASIPISRDPVPR